MKLLLHMCCGPCSCYPVKKLREEGIESTGYFFNPNIHPYKEWDMRLKTAKEFAEKVGMAFHADEHYRLRDFLKKALPAEALPRPPRTRSPRGKRSRWQPLNAGASL